MTLFYFNIIFLFIMFLVCSSSIFDIVMIDYEFMHKFAKRLIQYSSGLSGSQYVSVVLRYCMPMNALYMLGSVVDCGRDNNTVESFVTHTSYIELVEPGCREIV
jgi:hypothetical protein